MNVSSNMLIAFHNSYTNAILLYAILPSTNSKISVPPPSSLLPSLFLSSLTPNFLAIEKIRCHISKKKQQVYKDQRNGSLYCRLKHPALWPTVYSLLPILHIKSYILEIISCKSTVYYHYKAFARDREGEAGDQLPVCPSYVCIFPILRYCWHFQSTHNSLILMCEKHLF